MRRFGKIVTLTDLTLDLEFGFAQALRQFCLQHKQIQQQPQRPLQVTAYAAAGLVQFISCAKNSNQHTLFYSIVFNNGMNR